MSTSPRALDLKKIVQQIEQATGIRCGFPTDSDYQTFSHIVELSGLCRDRLGHDRFCTAYQIAVGAAVSLAPLDFLVEPIRDHRHVIVGYEFGFADAKMACTFRTQALASMAARGVL
jgi:hypothetical protein